MPRAPRFSGHRLAHARLVGLLITMLATAVACSGGHHAGSAGTGSSVGNASKGGAPAIGAASGAIGVPGASQPTPATVAQIPLLQRDVVHTATLDMTVPDVDRAAAAVLATTAAMGGRADQDDRTSSSSGRHAELILRVPPRNLEPLIAEVAGLGHENRRTDHADDVTAANADVTARVQELTISVARLQDFLKHSGTISDLIALESQLTQREADLQSTVAQQRALADQISLASLTVELGSTVKPVRHAVSGPAGFGSALLHGLRALLLALRWTGAALGYLLPFAIIAVAGSLLVVFGWRRRGHLSMETAQPLAEDRPS